MRRHRLVCPVVAGIALVVCAREAAACHADFTGGPGGNPDCKVSAADLLFLLANWGPCGVPCPADISGLLGVPDGVVGTFDLLALLAEWGPCPLDISEDPNMVYGYDDWTHRNLDPVVPIKSVEVGQGDTAILTFTPAAFNPAGLFITSETPANVTVAPAATNASPTTITVTGVAKGDSDVNVRRDNAAGPICRTMETTAYNKLTKTVAFVVVHEENDDTQAILLAQGQANTVCITAGPNGFLETLPGADDVVVGNEMNTGADGVCQTLAVADDVQVIGFFAGAPNVICVTAGANGFRDTVAPGGDDVVVGNDIDTGPNGVCETLANDTDVIGSGHGAVGAFTTYLNDVIYNQAVVEWTITEVTRLTVNYDLNRDGKIDVTPCVSPESMAIITAGAGIVGFDHVLFFVDNPDDDSCGCMPFSQTYGFMHPVSPCHTPQTLQNTVAHELGHGSVGLVHPDQNGDRDPTNLMHSDNVNPDKLRKNQWDQLNP